MGGDKKVRGGKLHLVLLDDVGAPVVEPALDRELLMAAWKRSMQTSEESA